MDINEVKVFQGLEKKSGLSIWIYASVDALPNWIKGWPTMMRGSILEYHSPSAKEFWDYLQECDRAKTPLTNWRTVITDKRVKISKPNEDMTIKDATASNLVELSDYWKERASK